MTAQDSPGRKRRRGKPNCQSGLDPEPEQPTRNPRGRGGSSRFLCRCSSPGRPRSRFLSGCSMGSTFVFDHTGQSEPCEGADFPLDRQRMVPSRRNLEAQDPIPRVDLLDAGRVEPRDEAHRQQHDQGHAGRRRRPATLPARNSGCVTAQHLVIGVTGGLESYLTAFQPVALLKRFIAASRAGHHCRTTAGCRRGATFQRK